MSSEASASESVSNPASASELEAMRRALDLALRGWGRVAPNPLVGAVVLGRSDGAIVGEGFHAEYGGPHAEVVALSQGGDASRGGTLVVTLEPCAHTGKTPPCTDAILAAGVSRVVVAIRDPDPVAAGGLEFLRSRGIDTSLGTCAPEVAPLEKSGVRVFRPASLGEGLRQLRAAGIHSLLCEGGGALGSKLVADGLVDRLYWVQAPVWLGEGAIPAFPGVAPAAIEAAPR